MTGDVTREDGNVAGDVTREGRDRWEQEELHALQRDKTLLEQNTITLHDKVTPAKRLTPKP